MMVSYKFYAALAIEGKIVHHKALKILWTDSYMQMGIDKEKLDIEFNCCISCYQKKGRKMKG